MAGYIQIDRKILKWEWYQDVKVFHLFLYFILRANWEDGRWKGIDVKRGQLITGRLQLSKDTGLSEREIRTCLEKLKTTGEVTIKTTSKYSIVTICKYDVYQNKYDNTDQRKDQQLDQPKTNERPTTDQQPTTNNNSINNNKEEESEENSTHLGFLKIYHSSYSDYKGFFNGKSATPEMFSEWKEMVDFIYEKEYTDLFNCRFLMPHEYQSIALNDGFSKDKWVSVFKKLLSTGIKKEHILLYRIPEFIKIVYKNDTSKASTGSVGKSIEFDRP